MERCNIAEDAHAVSIHCVLMGELTIFLKRAALALPAFLVVALSSAAVAQDWTGWYLGAHVGSSRVNTSAPAEGNGVNGGIHLGYHYQLQSRMILGGEVEYNQTDIDLDNGNRVTGLCRFKGVVGYARDDVMPYALAGVGKFRSDGLGEDFGWAVGVGLAYRVSETWALSGEFAYHEHSDIGDSGLDAGANALTLRASYRF